MQKLKSKQNKMVIYKPTKMKYIIIVNFLNGVDSMKCPFRKDVNGQVFMDCYGEDCMAYYEQQECVYDIENENYDLDVVAHCAMIENGVCND